MNPTLEVQGHPGIFALGDVIDWEEQKQAAKGTAHIAVVAPNVQSYLEGKPLKKVYNGSPEMILIPLGKVSRPALSVVVRADILSLQTGGSAYLGFAWGIVLGDWASRTIKGKDLFVSRARAERGL